MPTLKQAMESLERAHDAWRDGYRNNRPQQDSLDAAINAALTTYRETVNVLLSDREIALLARYASKLEYMFGCSDSPFEDGRSDSEIEVCSDCMACQKVLDRIKAAANKGV